jgi:hypothetical protein
VIVSVPRLLIVSLAAIFSAYHLVLAVVSIDVPHQKAPYIAAMVLFGVATLLSLLLSRTQRMPTWVAAFNVAVAVVVPLLVTSQFDQAEAKGTYAAWHTAAIGTLMVITSTRRRHTFAWIGTAALVVQTVAWAGPGGLVAYGVIGSVGWVAVSQALSLSLAKAGRDTRQYALAVASGPGGSCLREAGPSRPDEPDVAADVASDRGGRRRTHRFAAPRMPLPRGRDPR